MAKTSSAPRIDALFVIGAGLSAIVIIGFGKVLALKYHQHPVAQGFNVLF